MALSRFRATAFLGYSLVILPLGAALILGIGHLHGIAGDELERVVEQERIATEAEHVRWSAASAISAARGYVMSGNPAFLADLERFRSTFDRGLREIGSRTQTPEGSRLLGRVSETGSTYEHALEQAISHRSGGVPAEETSARFESQIIPLRRNLENALDELVAFRRTRARDAYREAEQTRARWMLEARLMTVALVLFTVILAWYFSRLLGRAHSSEQQALAMTRDAIRARDELMGIVAHDLRNPLAAISLKAQNLRRWALSQKTREDAESIENVATRMELLIRSILDVSTMEAGHFTVTPAPCDVDSLIEETMDIFRSLSASKRIQLDGSVAEPGLAVSADRDRVLQVLSNLIGNALKFTPPDGRVAVAVERQGDTACFAVSDTGPGIPPEKQARIFERFWKDEDSSAKGTGLGLFIAKKIIDAHGGRIWVDSHVGYGTTLYFTVPVAKEDDTEDSPRDSEPELRVQ